MDSALSDLGKNYHIQILNESSNDKDKIKFENNKFIITLKQTEDAIDSNHNSVIKSLYEDWLYSQACNIFQKKIKEFGGMVNANPKEIVVKKLKNRWRSATSIGTINLNYNLMKAPEAVIDYVIIHELCHFKIKGHSHKFWRYVHKFVPNYEDKVNWLGINGKYMITSLLNVLFLTPIKLSFPSKIQIAAA